MCHVLVLPFLLSLCLVFRRRVLQRLLKNKLFVKAEKCEFHAESVTFLGHIISTRGIKPDPAKIEAVAMWPVPDSRKALQRFLGFANFYRRYIRNFGQIAAPLTALTSTKVVFRWNPDAQVAFDALKSRFVSAPVLLVPDPESQFIVEIDASGLAQSFLSAHSATGRCTRVHFSLVVSALQNVTMTLAIRSCWW